MKSLYSEKPWIRKYDAGVPGFLDYPNIPIHDLLTSTAHKFPERNALIELNKTINYRELLENSTMLARNLVLLGIKPGDRIGLCLPNKIEFVVAFYGILMAGGIVAAINPTYPQAEIEFQVGISKISMLIGLQSQSDKMIQIAKKFELENLFLVEEEPADKNKLVKTSFRNLIKKPTELRVMPIVSSNKPAVFQFSGGTTGKPKAAVGLHRNIIANVCQFSSWLSTMKPGEETFLTAIPLFHVYGMVIGLNVGIAMGATIVLNSNPRDLELLLDQIEKYSVTFFPGVPTFYQSINTFSQSADRKINLRSIKACISGSAPLLEDTRIKFERLTGGKLVEGYGLSEAPTATHCNPIQGENRKGSIGLPLPDVECMIVDLENKEEMVKVGEPGELLIRGPQIMKEYYQQPLETVIALENDWLHTGDIAKMDQDGYFYIVGRKKELIKVGGLQVWPNEIEDVLAKHPAVKEIAAVGIPDDLMGQVIKVWIVPTGDYRITIEEVKEFCSPYLAAYKIPREIEFIESLPKSSVGKVLRRELVNNK